MLLDFITSQASKEVAYSVMGRNRRNHAKGINIPNLYYSWFAPW
jgi:uncharacterized protein YpmB